MKNRLKYTIILSAIALVLTLTACTTAKITPANKATGAPATTNYVVDPRLTQGLSTAGAINTATAPVNPFSPVVEIGLTSIAALATWFAKRKNDQLAAQTLIAKTIVQGVENADVQGVKDVISSHASKIGVEGELQTFVQKVNSGGI